MIVYVYIYMILKRIFVSWIPEKMGRHTARTDCAESRPKDWNCGLRVGDFLGEQPRIYT